MPGRCTAPRWSGCSTATAPSRRVRACGWPSAPPTCSGRAPRPPRPGLDVSGSPASSRSTPAPHRRRRRACAPTSTSSTPPCRTAYRRSSSRSCKTITLGGAVTGPRHRVDVVPQRPAARVGARDGRPHRRRRGRHRRAGRRARRPLPRLPQLLRHARLRDPAAHRARAGRSPSCALRHVRFHDLEALVGALERDRRRQVASTGEPVDYLDGVVFCATESYLTLGRQTDEPGPVSDYTGQRDLLPVPAARRPRPARDRLTTHDYLWRWDTDWFWCSPGLRRPEPAGARGCGPGAGGAAASTGSWSASTAAARSPTVSRPARAGRRASGWSRTSRSRWADAPSSCAGSCARSRSSRSGCARCGCARTGRSRRSRVTSPGRCTRCAPARPTSTSGSGRACRATRATRAATNRLIEQEVTALRRPQVALLRLLLREAEFDRLYGGDAYAALKARYDPDARLLDLYSKAVQRR